MESIFWPIYNAWAYVCRGRLAFEQKLRDPGGSTKKSYGVLYNAFFDVLNKEFTFLFLSHDDHHSFKQVVLTKNKSFSFVLLRFFSVALWIFFFQDLQWFLRNFAQSTTKLIIFIIISFDFNYAFFFVSFPLYFLFSIISF